MRFLRQSPNDVACKGQTDGLHLPFEIAKTIANLLDVEDHDINDKVLDKTARPPDLTEALRNLRLVNRIFAAAGAEVLFRRMTFRLESILPLELTFQLSPTWARRLKKCFPSNDEASPSYKKLHESLVRLQRAARCHLARTPQTQDPTTTYRIRSKRYLSLRGFQRAYQGLENLQRLSCSRFAHVAQELQLVVVSDAHGNESRFSSLITAWLGLLQHSSHRLSNLNTVKLVIQDCPGLSEHMRRKHKIYVNMILPLLQSSILGRLPRLKRLSIDAPEWARDDIRDAILDASPRLRELAIRLEISPLHRMSPGCPLPVVMNYVEKFFLSLGNSSEPLARINFAGHSCPMVRQLNIDLYGMDVHRLPDFVAASYKYLEAFEIRGLVSEDTTIDWNANGVIESLSLCKKLTRLCFLQTALYTSGDFKWNFARHNLRDVQFCGVNIDRQALQQVISDNRASLVRVTIVNTCLVRWGQLCTLERTKQQSWLPIIEVLLSCMNLEWAFLWGLQNTGGGNIVQLTWDDGIVDFCEQNRTTPITRHNRKHFEGCLRWFVLSEDPSVGDLSAVRHRLGELVRSISLRRKSWSGWGWGWLAEYEHEPYVKPSSVCARYFASLFPLDAIKAGTATSDDVYPWDPINGLRVEELAAAVGQGPSELDDVVEVEKPKAKDVTEDARNLVECIIML